VFKNLNPGALGFRVPFYETVRLAKIGDFQGIDLDLFGMKGILETKSVDEVTSLVKESDLKWGGWGLPVDFRGEEDTFQEGLKGLPSLAETACELGCLRVFTWIRPFSDELPFEENFAIHADRLASVAEILNDHQCALGLEFVAPKTLRVNRKYEFIHDMDGILRLRDATEAENVGVLLDCWHWYTSHGTLDQIRQLRGKDVVYVHVNDAPPGIPVDEQIDNARRLPGETGVIDIVGFLNVLKEIGYDGPVTPEPFEKTLKELPIEKAARKVGKALDQIWRSVGL
jgi:sugar phosphate isomerase/epimerase